MRPFRFLPYPALTSAVAVAVAVAFIAPVTASSHREAPAISTDAQVDSTDVYAFVSPDDAGTITIVACYNPLEEPSNGPNYYQFADDAFYDINIDNDGDAEADITYRFEFNTTNKNPATFLYNTGPITFDATARTYTNLVVEQRYTVRRIEGKRQRASKRPSDVVIGANLNVPPNHVGPKSIADYQSLVTPAIHTVSSGDDVGTRIFAGPRDDPFFIAVGRAFDLINIDGIAPGGREDQCGLGTDHLSGFNVHALAIQIPIARLTQDEAAPADANDPDAIIGVWTTASRSGVRKLPTKVRVGRPASTSSGTRRQVSRLGLPLVNELLIPRSNKDVFNASEPVDDAQFLPFIQNPELAGLLTTLFAEPVPPAPRTDLVDAFLLGLDGVNKKGVPAEYLRLNMLTPRSLVPNRLGALAPQADGFPNGRRLTDDVVDIALRVVAGALVPADGVEPEFGDGVCENDVPFLASFPYLATPHDGVRRQHKSEPVAPLIPKR